MTAFDFLVNPSIDIRKVSYFIFAKKPIAAKRLLCYTERKKQEDPT